MSEVDSGDCDGAVDAQNTLHSKQQRCSFGRRKSPVAAMTATLVSGGGGGDVSYRQQQQYKQQQPQQQQQRPSGEQLFAQSIHETLEQTGELRKLKAAMRATILNVIRGGDTSSINKVPGIYRTAANDLVHALIVDYLQWSGYNYAVEMFATESGTCVDGAGTGSDSKANKSAADPSSTASVVRRRMDLARRVAGGTADGGCRLADGVVDVPVLLAMVVQGMRMDDGDDEKRASTAGLL